MGSVSVSKNDKIIYSKSIGFSDVESEKKANSNSKYRIGSVSKTFTAVLVLKAVEENKLKLNQTIDKFFPTIKNSSKITIENLLNHRSGIHDFTEDKSYLSWLTQPKSETEMVKIITEAGSDFEPNSKASYSNSNYVLLSYILEKSFKKQYSELLQKYIVKSVGLENTFLGNKIKIGNNECKSYTFKGSWKLENETDISIPLGAGGIVSTPNDLIKFCNALFNGKVLKKESIEVMKNFKDGYGLGLFKIPFGYKISYGHNGSIDGFSSIFGYFPAEKISFAITSNGSNYNNNNITLVLLSAIFNQPYKIPKFTSYKVSSKDLDKYLGKYISKQMPLSITPLESIKKDKFKSEKVGVVLEFNPTEKTMILKQGKETLIFIKE